MRFFKLPTVLGLATLLLVSWTSCESVRVRGASNHHKEAGNTINPKPKKNRGNAVINTKGFLVTPDARLTSWLDQRFQVKYISMTPQLIFDQVPLNEIKYETHNLPVDSLPFDYQSKNISRRELLKKISNFWKLDMTLVTGSDGAPVAVRVSG